MSDRKSEGRRKRRKNERKKTERTKGRKIGRKENKENQGEIVTKKIQNGAGMKAIKAIESEENKTTIGRKEIP